MIGIVDYGAGNLHSVGKALDYLGRAFLVLERPDQADDVERLILPGVGAFGAAAERLAAAGWMGRLKEWVANDQPLFGICLGMQLLFESSEESPNAEGLGVLPGVCRRLCARKVPQIGWNRAESRREHPLLHAIPGSAHFYFVHGFFVEPTGPDVVLAQTRYEEVYASVVGRGRLTGVQFHPEKSGPDGLRLLRNWSEKC
jgi:imidazole glycerol phosphate synthase glutamine amidotransferase subunit